MNISINNDWINKQMSEKTNKYLDNWIDKQMRG